LEETAFYLDSVSTSHKPVVLTGSMKNASELGYDGLTNLDSSIRTVLSPSSRDRGVLVVMNYQIHAAREVTKTHTLNLDTFKSIEFGPLGIIDDDDVLYYRKQSLRNVYRLNNTYEPRVGLIKVVVGMDGELLDYYIDKGYKGLVIEAFGRGNVPAAMMDGIKRARKAGIEIVVVSRVMSGRVLDTYGYIGGGKDLVRHSCILGRNLSGQKARILLMVALGNDFGHEQLRDLFS
ncbi:MAG: asparaginase, partial [Bacillota bacterium]